MGRLSVVDARSCVFAPSSPLRPAKSPRECHCHCYSVSQLESAPALSSSSSLSLHHLPSSQPSLILTTLHHFHTHSAIFVALGCDIVTHLFHCSSISNRQRPPSETHIPITTRASAIVISRLLNVPSSIDSSRPHTTSPKCIYSPNLSRCWRWLGPRLLRHGQTATRPR
jgi:hypothetical protein